MKYTYRYSTVQEITVSWICPICRSKTSISKDEIENPYKWAIKTHELCCSSLCTEEYEKRIRHAIAWGSDIKVSRVTQTVSAQHYNGIRIPLKKRGKYHSIASVLANLGEYFPFNLK